jgi:hypothetical protein
LAPRKNLGAFGRGVGDETFHSIAMPTVF